VPDLEPRQQLDLRIVTGAGEHLLRTLVVRHERAANRLLVDWPADNMRLFPMRPGQRIVVELTRIADALYSVEAVLEGATMEEPPHLTLRLSGDWQRVQRRSTLRHLVNMRPTECVRFATEGEREEIDVHIVDLSTGGMRLESRTPLTVGDELEMTFGTPSGGASLRLRMTVLRVGDGMEAGCQFLESSEQEREQIVHFILAQQNAVSRLG
jgi:c-di-GMP-binding flagellar brake protein YcgR